ncbi:MAG TPA: hypothetical protein VHR72_04830 [Gemmataceae bacterium]|jgi:hypothetical protein|nr:hypothetical protein [Gemmataceae bacterium]
MLRTWLLLVAALVLPMSAGPASAQYPYNPYYPGGYGYGWGAGAALQGQAEVLKAVGTLAIDQEKSRIEREKANRAKLETRKATLNEMLYEKSMTPTYGEEAALDENKKVQRMMTTPVPGEISSGKTLNQFLPFLQRIMSQGIQGPPVPLDPYALSRINVTMGGNGPNLSLLRQNPIPWPLGLRGPLQMKLAAVLKTAVAQATKDELDPAVYRDAQTLTKQLKDDFSKRFQADEASATDFLQVTPFLDQLQSNILALGQPGVNRILDGSYSARGSNVPELVAYMTGNGLTFAPGAPGSEAAYQGLHNAFVAYINAAQASTGFQIQTKLALPPNLR